MRRLPSLPEEKGTGGREKGPWPGSTFEWVSIEVEDRVLRACLNEVVSSCFLSGVMALHTTYDADACVECAVSLSRTLGSLTYAHRKYVSNIVHTCFPRPWSSAVCMMMTSRL